MLLLVSVSVSASESSYSLKKVVDAAGKVLAGRTEFALFNLPEPKGDAAMLLEYLNQASEAQVPLVIAAPKLEFISDLVTATMNIAGEKRFDGLVLVIIGPRKDEEMFAALVKQRGFKIVCGAYE